MPTEPAHQDQDPQPDVLPSDALVDVVAFVRMPSHGWIPSPAETDAIVSSILERVEVQTGIHPEEIHVFSNMHSFAVRATMHFVDALSADSDVDYVTDNDQPKV